tara:strand:- start:100 stop:636 length:537 start_codon:yes stop_codon:yes gene_type:complete
MKKNIYTTASIFLIILVLFSRIIPHAPNFTPLISIVLVSSLLFKGKRYFALPLIGLFLSDILLESFYFNGYIFSSIFFWTYASLAFVFIFSFKFNNGLNIKNVLFHSFSGPLIFFIVSNFGVWIMGGYSYTIMGFITCYTAAIPFFKNTLSSTLIYSAILFAPALYKKYTIAVKQIHS